MAAENTGREDTQDVTGPGIAPPEPANSSNASEVREVRVDAAAAPRVAPPKAWNSRKPPGGKLSEKAEPPQGSKSG